MKSKINKLFAQLRDFCKEQNSIVFDVALKDYYLQRAEEGIRTFRLSKNILDLKITIACLAIYIIKSEDK